LGGGGGTDCAEFGKLKHDFLEVLYVKIVNHEGEAATSSVGASSSSSASSAAAAAQSGFGTHERLPEAKPMRGGLILPASASSSSIGGDADGGQQQQHKSLLGLDALAERKRQEQRDAALEERDDRGDDARASKRHRAASPDRSNYRERERSRGADSYRERDRARRGDGQQRDREREDSVREREQHYRDREGDSKDRDRSERNYRERRAETPSNPGGVSDDALDRVRDISRRAKGRGKQTLFFLLLLHLLILKKKTDDDQMVEFQKAVLAALPTRTTPAAATTTEALKHHCLAVASLCDGANGRRPHASESDWEPLVGLGHLGLQHPPLLCNSNGTTVSKRCRLAGRMPRPGTRRHMAILVRYGRNEKS